MNSTKKLKIETAPLASLVMDPENARIHGAKNLATIQASLEAHGQVQPLLVQKSTRMIIAGNGRATAMQAAGWDHAEVTIVDVDDATARRLSIALNRTGDTAEWDEDLLFKQLRDLNSEHEDFDFMSLGFDDEEAMKGISALAAMDIDTAELAQPEGEPEEDFVGEGQVPAGAPGRLHGSHVRMIQLFFNNESIVDVKRWCKRLSQEYGTDDATSTVYEALKRECLRVEASDKAEEVA
jgi:hypothetical protein